MEPSSKATTNQWEIKKEKNFPTAREEMKELSSITNDNNRTSPDSKINNNSSISDNPETSEDEISTVKKKQTIKTEIPNEIKSKTKTLITG